MLTRRGIFASRLSSDTRQLRRNLDIHKSADLTNDFSALLLLTPGSFELSGIYFGSEEAYHNVSTSLVQSFSLRDGDTLDVYSVTESIDLYTQIYGNYSPVAEPKSIQSIANGE